MNMNTEQVANMLTESGFKIEAVVYAFETGKVYLMENYDLGEQVDSNLLENDTLLEATPENKNYGDEGHRLVTYTKNYYGGDWYDWESFIVDENDDMEEEYPCEVYLLGDNRDRVLEVLGKMKQDCLDALGEFLAVKLGNL